MAGYRKLGRTSSHRWAMLRNMVTSLIEHERIRTTTAKAKELRRVADRMITWAKEGTLHARRQAAMVVRTREHLKKLFDVLGPRYLARPGGYTRVMKLQRYRPGDAADMSLIEFVGRQGELRPARQASQGLKDMARLQTPPKSAAAAEGDHSTRQKRGRPSDTAITTAGAKKHRKRSRGESSQPHQPPLPPTPPPSTKEEATPSSAHAEEVASPASVIAPEEAAASTTGESSSPVSQQHQEQPPQQEEQEAAGAMERGGRGRSLALLLLLLCFSLLAALEYRRGGRSTQHMLSWTGLVGGKEAGGEGDGQGLLMIAGGGAGKGAGGDTRAVAKREGEALVVHPDNAAAAADGWRRGKRKGGKKRAALANAGKAVFKALGLPIKTVLGGLRKLLSLAKGGRGRAGAGKGPQAAIGQHPHRPVTFVDLNALGEEERGMVEDTYQDLAARPGLIARGRAVGLVIDRECVARYYIAEKWRRDPKSGPSMADNIARTVRWREEERVDKLGADDVARQAWNGYLYTNGTDKMGRPLIYYRPADQSAKRPEEAIRYLVYTLERALAAGRRNGGVEAYSFIIDCGGFSLSNMPPVHLIKQTFQLLHHHYPTRVGFICMLYTGSAFQLLWKVLNPLVSPMTRNKILFAPSGQEAVHLLERIDPHQLERRFGGSKDYGFDAPAYFGLSADETQRLGPGGEGAHGA